MWGHFCLCFDGEKLLDDNKYIADYEIRDGDQVVNPGTKKYVALES